MARFCDAIPHCLCWTILNFPSFDCGLSTSLTSESPPCLRFKFCTGVVGNDDKKGFAGEFDTGVTECCSEELSISLLILFSLVGIPPGAGAIGNGDRKELAGATDSCSDELSISPFTLFSLDEIRPGGGAVGNCDKKEFPDEFLSDVADSCSDKFSKSPVKLLSVDSGIRLGTGAIGNGCKKSVG